jgi:predicted amino acid dehydrogenase
MINSLGFIGHPIDFDHLYRMMGPFSFIAKKIPKYTLKEFLKNLSAFRLNTIRNMRSAKDVLIDCHTVICPLLPQDMVALDEEIVLNKITKAVRLAERLGAKIATLGGFTSVIGNEGQEVSKRVNIAVTSGNTYTAALAIEGIIRAAYYMDVSLPKASLTVIGATGDIGSICTRILAKKVRQVNLVARNEPRLNKLAEEIGEYNSNVKVHRYTREAVKDADIVLTVTSAVSALIEPENLKPGSIVCDVAIPANIAKEVINVRNDVFVFEGGLAKLPYQNEIKDRKFNELMPTGSIYGCLAEGVALAFEGRFENYSIGRGRITEAKVNEISGIAKKHGLKLAEFFCGYRFYSEEDIESIRRNARKNLLNERFIKK